MRAGDAGLNGREREQRRAPIQDMYVDGAGLLRGDAPIAGLHRTAAGSVDRFAVTGHPFADGVKTRDKLLLNFTVGHGTDIEKEIGVIAGGADEELFELGGTL